MKSKWKDGTFSILGAEVSQKRGIVTKYFGIDLRFDGFVLTHIPTQYACGAFKDIESAKQFAQWLEENFDVSNFKQTMRAGLSDEDISRIKQKGQELGVFQSGTTLTAEEQQELEAAKK